MFVFVLLRSSTNTVVNLIKLHCETIVQQNNQLLDAECRTYLFDYCHKVQLKLKRNLIIKG